MGRIQKTERQIIERLAQHDEGTVRTFKIMLSYFRLHDILEHTNHTATIFELYLNKRNYNKSNVALELATHLSDGTFYRYRNMYLECFELIQSGEFDGLEEVAVTDD